MTTHLIRVVADRMDLGFVPPRSVDLPADGQPAVLRFHGVPRESIGLWLKTFRANGTLSHRSAQEINVDTWTGHHFGVPVQIKLYSKL